MGAETTPHLDDGLVLLLTNAFFIVSEFVMTRVPQFGESAFEGFRGLELTWEMTERLEVYPSDCQVGVTIASVGLGVVAGPAVVATFNAVLGGGGAAGSHTSLLIGLALAVINLSHIVPGEQVPTYLGVKCPRAVAKYTTPVLYDWTKLIYPVIVAADWLAKHLLSLVGVEITRSWQGAELDDKDGDGSAGEGTRLTRGEVRSQMGDALSQGSPPEDRREEVLNVLRIDGLPVRDATAPADHVVALSVDATIDESLGRVRSSLQYSRFPLVGDSLDDVRDVVYAPTVLSNIDRLQSGDCRLNDIAAPPLSVPSDLSVSNPIDHFQEENQKLAMVRDPENGSVVGLVTTSGVFESITGQLYDPLDLGA